MKSISATAMNKHCLALHLIRDQQLIQVTTLLLRFKLLCRVAIRQSASFFLLEKTRSFAAWHGRCVKPSKVFLVSLFFICSPLAAKDSEVVVHDHEGWQVVDARVREELSRLSFGAEIIDVSVRSRGGYGWIARQRLDQSTNPEYARGYLSGYLDAMSRGELFVESTERTKVGFMEGFRILARGKNSDKINAVIYLLFAERDCYVVMSLINSDSSQSNSET